MQFKTILKHENTIVKHFTCQPNFLILHKKMDVKLRNRVETHKRPTQVSLFHYVYQALKYVNM
jgi:hypothetical protein